MDEIHLITRGRTRTISETRSAARWAVCCSTRTRPSGPGEPTCSASSLSNRHGADALSFDYACLITQEYCMRQQHPRSLLDSRHMPQKADRQMNSSDVSGRHLT